MTDEKLTLKKAKEIFYSLLKGVISEKEYFNQIKKYKIKNKTLKGYLFGVEAILRKKKRKYAYRVGNRSVDLKLLKMMTMLASNRFISDFEKGYYIAWKDYLIFVTKGHE